MKLDILRYGFGIVGAPLIWAGYFASLRDGDGESISYLLTIPLSCVIVAAVNVAWFFLIKATLGVDRAPESSLNRVPEWFLEIATAWRNTACLVLEIAAFLVFSQSFSRSRSSPMHIPSEFAYVPGVVAFMFIVPGAVLGSRARKCQKHASANALSVDSNNVFCGFLCEEGSGGRHSAVNSYVNLTLGSTLLWFGAWVVILARLGTQEVDNSPPLQWLFSGIMLGMLTVVYATPCIDDVFPRPSAPDVWAWVLITFLKCAFLVGTIVVFTETTAPRTSTHPHMHDYYSLRSLTQKDSSVHGAAPRVLSAFPHPERVAVGFALRLACLFNACRILVDARVTFLKWLRMCKIVADKHLRDTHEIMIIYATGCILTAVLAVGSETSYNSVAESASHSMGIAWGLLILLVLYMAAVLMYALKR